MKLGVNIDHIATLREARGTAYPEPAVGALLAEYAGCSSIVAHLREDRRHIKERDMLLIKKAIKMPFNMEMSVNKDIVDFALKIKPEQSTLVPERRLELTTEGGIDLTSKNNYRKVEDTIRRLKGGGITVSLFIDPNKRQIGNAKKIGADLIELNTGKYSEAKSAARVRQELLKIKRASSFAKTLGFFVAAGHGLDYENVKEIVNVKEIEELNIGHSIICRSVFIGLVAAVEEMIGLISCRLPASNNWRGLTEGGQAASCR